MPLEGQYSVLLKLALTPNLRLVRVLYSMGKGVGCQNTKGMGFHIL